MSAANICKLIKNNYIETETDFKKGYIGNKNNKDKQHEDNFIKNKSNTTSKVSSNYKGDSS